MYRSYEIWTKEQENFLIEHYHKKGFSSTDIATFLGKTKNSVFCHVRRLGLSKKQVELVGDFPRHIWNNTKKRAKDKMFEMDISEEYLFNLLTKQDYCCALSGAKLIASNNTNLNTVSVDRIDSNKGYTKKNVQIVHKDFNVLKMAHKEIELLKMCKKTIEHLSKRFSKTEFEDCAYLDTEIPVRVFSENPVLEQDLHKDWSVEALF